MGKRLNRLNLYYNQLLITIRGIHSVNDKMDNPIMAITTPRINISTYYHSSTSQTNIFWGCASGKPLPHDVAHRSAAPLPGQGGRWTGWLKYFALFKTTAGWLLYGFILFIYGIYMGLYYSILYWGVSQSEFLSTSLLLRWCLQTRVYGG